MGWYCTRATPAFDQLAEQSRTYTREVDQNGLNRNVSDSITAVLDYASTEVIGKMHFHDLYPEPERDNFRLPALEVVAYFSAMPDMVVVGTHEGRVFYSNDEVTQKLGYRLEEINHIGILDTHPADQQQEVRDIFAAMFLAPPITWSIQRRR